MGLCDRVDTVDSSQPHRIIFTSLCHRVAQLRPHPYPYERMNPQALRIAQPTVLALNLREHHLSLTILSFPL